MCSTPQHVEYAASSKVLRPADQGITPGRYYSKKSVNTAVWFVTLLCPSIWLSCKRNFDFAIILSNWHLTKITDIDAAATS